MDSQLRLHIENLGMFLEPTFNRQTIGYYSTTGDSVYKGDDSEKASLVALKEQKKPNQGFSVFEVPSYIEQLDLNEGHETYNDSYDEPRQVDLLRWLKKHPKDCLDVDIVCTQKTLSKIFRAPYTETTATPWEIKVTRGPDGICYVEEDEDWQVKYDEMNTYAKQQHFRQKSFQRYMTIKKGVRNMNSPPSDHSDSFYRVNKLHVDSGVVVYQSEIQCFDINYNAIELKAQQDGQYDLPSPSTRLRWWSDTHLAGNNTMLCGYYDDDDEDGTSIHRLLSFETKHIKPNMVRDKKFDAEICAGSLCTFVQFIKDVTLDGTIQSFVLRFEPGSKRMCILELAASKSFASEVPSFGTQISATDETSSVEATPRSLEDDSEEDTIINKTNGLTKKDDNAVPRLRKVNRQDSTTAGPGLKRRNTLTTEMGGEITEELRLHDQAVDNDDNKYTVKLRRRNKAEDMEDVNWAHLAILFTFIGFALIGVPWTVEWLGYASPY